MTATEVSRNFSGAVNRVDSGEEIVIVRNGKPIAEMRRPSRPTGLTSAALMELLDSLPTVDEDFASDIEESRASVGSPTGKWPAA